MRGVFIYMSPSITILAHISQDRALSFRLRHRFPGACWIMVLFKKVLSILAVIAISLISAATNITITRMLFQGLGGSFAPDALPHAASRQLRGSPDDLSKEIVNKELITEHQESQTGIS